MPADPADAAGAAEDPKKTCQNPDPVGITYFACGCFRVTFVRPGTKEPDGFTLSTAQASVIANFIRNHATLPALRN